MHSSKAKLALETKFHLDFQAPSRRRNWRQMRISAKCDSPAQQAYWWARAERLAAILDWGTEKARDEYNTATQGVWLRRIVEMGEGRGFPLLLFRSSQSCQFAQTKMAAETIGWVYSVTHQKRLLCRLKCDWPSLRRISKGPQLFRSCSCSSGRILWWMDPGSWCSPAVRR